MLDYFQYEGLNIFFIIVHNVSFYFHAGKITPIWKVNQVH